MPENRDMMISVEPDTYIDRMRQIETYGNYITLIAMCHVYNVQFVVISSKRSLDCLISASGTYNKDIQLCLLGHDTTRIHYLSLHPPGDMNNAFKSVRGMPNFGKLYNCLGC